MKKKKEPTGKSGKRYTDEEKAEVVKFVKGYDNKNGRGGKSAAVKKFGISALTVAKWVGGKTKKSRKKPTPQPKQRKSSTQPANTAAKLQRMLEIQNQLDALRTEFDELKRAL